LPGGKMPPSTAGREARRYFPNRNNPGRASDEVLAEAARLKLGAIQAGGTVGVDFSPESL
jgi:hypothetical protein